MELNLLFGRLCKYTVLHWAWKKKKPKGIIVVDVYGFILESNTVRVAFALGFWIRYSIWCVYFPGRPGETDELRATHIGSRTFETARTFWFFFFVFSSVFIIITPGRISSP